MAQQSTTEIERDEQDGRAPVSPPRRKARADTGADEGADDGDDDEGDARPGLDPREVREMIMTLLSVPPEVAGAALGLGRNASYKACKTKQITSFFIGGKLVCPTAPLRQMLCIDDPAPQGAPVPQVAAHPKKQEMKMSPKPQRRRGR